MKKKLLTMLLALAICLPVSAGMAGCFDGVFDDVSSSGSADSTGATDSTDSTDSADSTQQQEKKYLVKFVDEEGNVLKEEEVKEGETPVAPTATTPENTAEYTYSGAWDKEIVAVSGEATYTWIVTATKNSYLVKFVDEEGETLKEETLEYGVTPVAPNPTLPDDTVEHTYLGAWDKEIVAVSGEAVYTWIVTEYDKEYTITFLDAEGAVLQSSAVKPGELPTCTVALPALPEDTAEYAYSWAWDKEIVAVTGEATYQLQLVSAKKSYTISFVTEDGNILQSDSVEYGVTPVAPNAATPENTAEYTYSGAWDKEIAAVSGEETYTWIVTATKNSYLIKFVDEAGETLKEETLEYGVTPVAPTTTTPENTAEYTYSGAWDKEIVAVSGEATYTWIVTATKNKYQVTFDGANEAEYEYGATVTAPALKQQGKALTGWTVNGETVDIATYTVTGVTEFVSVWSDVPYATNADGYVNAVASEELGAGSWYYEIGSQETVYTWTVNLPVTAYAENKTTTYAWKGGDWSSVGFVENNWISGGGTAREGTISVTNIGGELIVVINEPTQNITKSTSITDADIIGGNKALTIVVNNGAQYRHFYLGAGVVTDSALDAFVVDNEGNKHVANKTADSVEYALSQSYGDGVVTVPKMNYSQYTKVMFDWNIAGGWTFIGPEAANRWYNGGTALGGTVTVVVKADKLEVTMTQTLDSANNGTFTAEITDTEIINGIKSLTLSYNCLVGTQTLVLNNFTTSTDPVEEEPVDEPDTFVIDSEGNQYAATETENSIEYSLASGYNSGVVTLPKMNYSQYTQVTFDWNIAGGWTFIGPDAANRWYNGGTALGGSVTIINNGNGTLTLTMTQTLDSANNGTFTVEITDADIINGTKSLTLSYQCLVGTQTLVLSNFNTVA